MMNGKNYTELSGKDKFLVLLQRSIQDKVTTLSWVNIEQQRVLKQIQFLKLNLQENKLRLHILKSEKNFLEKMTKDGFLNFFLSSDATVFRLKLIASIENDFWFELPDSFLRVERRKNHRVDFKGKQAGLSTVIQQIDDNFKLQSYKGTCVDVSATGFSVAFNYRRAKDFKVNQYLNDVVLENDEIRVACGANVVYVKEGFGKIDQHDEFRLGFEFLNLTPKQKILIEKYVVENM